LVYQIVVARQTIQTPRMTLACVYASTPNAIEDLFFKKHNHRRRSFEVPRHKIREPLESKRLDNDDHLNVEISNDDLTSNCSEDLKSAKEC
jgi:hypothetical protein